MHYQNEDEANEKAKERSRFEAHQAKSLDRRAIQKDTEYDILHGADKRPGKEGQQFPDEPTKPLTWNQKRDQAAADRLHGLMRHAHSLDRPPEQFQTTHNQTFLPMTPIRKRTGSGAPDGMVRPTPPPGHGPSRPQHGGGPRGKEAAAIRSGAAHHHGMAQGRFGVNSGMRNEEFTRYEVGSAQTAHMQSHANDESARIEQSHLELAKHGHEDAAGRYDGTRGRLHLHGDHHANEESQQRDAKWEHHAHQDAASRYGSGRVHVHGGEHTHEETAGKETWNAGSGEAYAAVEQRKTGATILKRRRSLTHAIGAEEHVSLEAQRHAQHLDALASNVTSQNGELVRRPSQMAHHKPYGQQDNPSDETGNLHHKSDGMANHGEDSTMRFAHAQHHHTSYAHNQDETDEGVQFHAANLAGEQNRFYVSRPNEHHKAVGLDESTTSKQVWESLKSEGYETYPQRSSAPLNKPKDPAESVKAVTSKNRTRLVNSPRSDHWKYDGEKDRVYKPFPPPRRTDANVGVARFI